MKKNEKINSKTTSAPCPVRNAAKTRATADKSQLVGPVDERKLNEERRKSERKTDAADEGVKGTCDSNQKTKKSNGNESFESVEGNDRSK